MSVSTKVSKPPNASTVNTHLHFEIHHNHTSTALSHALNLHTTPHHTPRHTTPHYAKHHPNHQPPNYKLTTPRPTMFTIKNVTRAALVSAALSSATADVLSHQAAQVAGEVPTSLGVNQQHGSGGGDMFVDTAALMGDAISAATEATNTEDLTVGVSAAAAQELTSGPLRAIVDFEAKLFGAETDEALAALVAEMKESEQGHDEEVRAAIASLDDMRGQVDDVLETVEESDRAILIAEFFTAM